MILMNSEILHTHIQVLCYMYLITFINIKSHLVSHCGLFVI